MAGVFCKRKKNLLQGRISTDSIKKGGLSQLLNAKMFEFEQLFTALRNGLPRGLRETSNKSSLTKQVQAQANLGD